jgi:hypothetical protein
MRVRKARLVIPLVLGSLACNAAQAQTTPSPTQFTIGAKVWHASWLSYLPAPYTGIGANGAPAAGDSVTGVEGDVRTSVLPLLGVRHGKFFASASYGRFKSDFQVNTSPVITPAGQTLITSRTDHFKRSESDLNVGYFVTPEVGIALGYKDATETRDTSLGIAPQPTRLVTTRAKGILLGATANFAVYDKLRLYGQAAYGPARIRLDFTDPTLAAPKANGRYLIGEVGLSYQVFSSAGGFGGATAALGYRTQTIKTDGYSSTFQQGRDLRDVRDGLALTLTVLL